MAKAEFYTVKASFINDIGEYHEGQVVTNDDAAFRKYPHLFVPFGTRQGDGIEQATAAPGEQRDVVLSSEPVTPKGKAMRVRPEEE
jgi:hypothetical protein